jgi:hypothetical protein
MGAQIQLTFERILYLPPLIRDGLSSLSKIQNVEKIQNVR